MNKKKSPIKIPILDKILMIFAPIALIVLMVGSVLVINSYRDEQVEYTYDTLTESCTNKALYFNDQLQFNLRLVKALTTFPEIYTMDRETQADFFKGRAAILGYSQFFVVDNDGISYYFSDGTERDQSDEPFFENISAHETYITEPYFTGLGPIMTLCAAIYDEDDNRVGTLCATFNITYIQNIIKDSVSSITVKSFILSKDGIFIAVDSLGDTSDQNSVFDDPDNDLALISEVFDSGESSNGIINLDGTEYYAAVNYMENTSWVLVECTETSTIASHIRKIEMAGLLFAFILLIMLFEIFHIIHTWQKNFTELHIDPLCGCGSRAACLEMISDLEKSKKSDIGILYMDLNNFKQVNDSFGHEEGDAILKIFADVIMQYLAPLGFVGRIGGDEFVAIFKNVDKQKVYNSIESVENELSVRSKQLSFDYKIDAAFGYVEQAADSGNTINDLLRSADNKMYENKIRRKNYSL